MRAANVTWDGISLHDVKEMDFTPSEFQTYALKRGDLLLSEASGSAGEVGKPAVWRNEVPDCCFQNTLIRVRVLPELVSFLLWRFRHDALSGLFAQASRGVGIYHLGARALAEWMVAFPGAREGSKIVDALDSYWSRLDDAEASLERVQQNLKRYRASVLSAAVEGRLVPTEAELAREEGRDYEPAGVLLTRILKERRRRWEEAELAKLVAKGKPPKNDKWKAKYKKPIEPDPDRLPGLPEGWCWTTVDAIGDVLLGRQRAPQYLTGEHSRPYLRVANVKDDSLDLSDIKWMDFAPDHYERYRLLPGDILVSEGQSPELVGQSAIYQGGIEELCFQKTLHRFRPVPFGPGSEFAQLVFRAHVKSGVFRTIASITTNIAHLTLIKFRGSPFPLPPQPEQDRILERVSAHLETCKMAEQASALADQRMGRLRQAVLGWAFEGRLVDQDPDDEPAEVLLERIRTEREKRSGKPKPRGRRKARKTE